MMTRLDISKNKLEGLKNEEIQAYDDADYEQKLIPFGQPNIIGKKDIYKTVNQKYNKAHQLSKAVEQQENRVNMLEMVANFKEKNALLQDVHVVGKTEYATIGAKTSVNNIDYFKEQLERLEQANIEAKEHNRKRAKNVRKAKTYGAEITKLKDKIEYLESLTKKAQKDSNVISEKSQELINSGKITKWQKKPIYYFVKGLRKVALEINSETGDFKISQRYAPQNEVDLKIVHKLLEIE